MSTPAYKQLKAWLVSECSDASIDTNKLQKFVDSQPDSFYQGDCKGFEINMNDFAQVTCRPICNFKWKYDQGTVSVHNDKATQSKIFKTKAQFS